MQQGQACFSPNLRICIPIARSSRHTHPPQGMLRKSIRSGTSYYDLFLFRIHNIVHIVIRSGKQVSAAAREPQYLLSLKRAKPLVRYSLRGSQINIPFAILSFLIYFMGDRFSPFPAFPDPSVYRLSIDILIIHICHPFHLA